jgi:ATP-dependent helicase IRC3
LGVSAPTGEQPSHRTIYPQTNLFSYAGSGKTAIFTSLIRYLPPLIHPTTGESATRVLIIVNSIQLATQTAEVVRRTYPEMSVEVEQGNKKATGLAQVTVATYQVRLHSSHAPLPPFLQLTPSLQTLSRGEASRLDKFDPDYFKAVIVDEASS